MRILHAPTNVANQSWALAEGLRSRGHHVEVWNYGPSPNGFPVDRVIDTDDDPATYLKVLWEAVERDFDVFHFHTTRSLMPSTRHGAPQFWDLPLLRSMGKVVAFSFHGSDVRLASHHRDDDEWSWYRFSDVPCDEERIQTRLAVIRHFAQVQTVSSVLDNVYVPTADYLPKCLDLRSYPPAPPVDRDRPLVVHATRRRATKGTDLLIRGMEELARRYRFDFRVVEGLDHPDLLDTLAAADVVVEKVLGGDAGVLSLEAMALGKVAVARIREEVLQAHPEMPVVSATPASLAESLGPVLTSPSLRRELGEAGRSYVEAHHSSVGVAARLEALYRAAKPGATRPHPDWANDPSPRRLETAYARIGALEEKTARLVARSTR